MALVSVLFVCGMVAEAALILLLIRLSVFRILPAFFLFLCWSLFSDALLYGVRLEGSPATFFRIYLIQLIIDSAMMFAVLVELAWSVLRPIRDSLPKRSWVGIAVVIALAGLLLWPVAGLTVPPYLTHQGENYFRLQQTFALLRVLFFLGLAGFSQVLSIGWRNRELQIATGLGFYSIASLAVSVLHTYQVATSPQYHWLDELGAMSYLGVLGYWVFSFATKEAVRQDFTPQMQHLLLAVAGAARSTRVALSDSESAQETKPGDR